VLRQQEIIAIELLFQGPDRLSQEIRERICSAESINWEETGVGFYSTIKFKKALSELPNIPMSSYAFKHPEYPHGGVFNCMFVNNCELELEGVALGGARWPNPDSIEKFEELIE
jgi:hypothetical protein